MPMIEADPNAERIQKDREQKLALFAAAILKQTNTAKTLIENVKQLDFEASHQLVMEKLNLLLEVGVRMESATLHYELKRFGDVMLTTSINFIINTFTSLISSGRKCKFYNDNVLLETLNAVLNKLTAIEETAEAKLGVTPQGRLLTIKNARDALAAKRHDITSKPLLVSAKARNFKEFGQSTNVYGKSIQDLLEARNDQLDIIETEDAKLLAEETRLKSMSLHDSIAQNTIEQISRIVNGESRDLVQQVRSLGLGSTRAYSLLRGAVIITGRLNPTGFRNAGFSVFEMSGQYILLDQIILAVLLPPSEDRHKKFGSIQTRGLSDQKSKSSKQKIKHPQGLGRDLTSQEVLNILSAKGENYIDVASASLDKMTPYELFHPEIDDVAFIWLMEKPAFLKATQGNIIKIRNVQLPIPGKSLQKQPESIDDRMKRQKLAREEELKRRKAEAEQKTKELLDKQKEAAKKEKFMKNVVKPKRK